MIINQLGLKSMMQFDKEPSIYYVSKGLRGWVKKVEFFFLTFNSIFADEILGGWVGGWVGRALKVPKYADVICG